jgi:hypothetical protein
MPYVKRMICLANSYKPRGRCIAGKEVLAENRYGGWIRPVSSRPGEEVSLSECRYRDHVVPNLLDIIDVPLLTPAPNQHQSENHTLDPERRWVRTGSFSWAELEPLCDRPRSLWINRESTRLGQNDCLTQSEASLFRTSLFLIKMKDFTVELGSKVWDGVKTRVYRGVFRYGNADHNLSVTDPAVRDAFADKSEGVYPLRNVYLCISLTEPYEEDGRCHKLVPAVIANPPL